MVQAPELTHKAAPNPFFNNLAITFELPERQEILLQVQSLRGEVIKTLKSSIMDAGKYQVNWDGTDAAGNEVPSGIYIYSIRTARETASGKLIKQ